MQIESAVSGGRRAWLASRVIAAFAVSLAFAAVLPASAATLERIQETGHIKLGYVANARPFTSRNDAGTAEGYSVTLCQQVVERVKKQLGRTDLAVDWVPVTISGLVTEVQQGNIDLLCTPISQTLSRRKDVAFSIPVFPGGVRAVLRNDSAAALRDALSGTPSGNAVWRGSPAATVLGQKSFAVVSGTTTESWLAGKLTSFQIDSKIVPVADYQSALKALLDREVDAVFGDRALVLGAMDASASENLTILPRLMTHEPLAFALARGDDDFRLLVDRTLSEIYASDGFAELYATWCGEFDDSTRAFFQWNTMAP
jgi:ABC-type amino acid transport substrate-binding protein